MCVVTFFQLTMGSIVFALTLCISVGLLKSLNEKLRKESAAIICIIRYGIAGQKCSLLIILSSPSQEVLSFCFDEYWKFVMRLIGCIH